MYHFFNVFAFGLAFDLNKSFIRSVMLVLYMEGMFYIGEHLNI